jgi:hypothetical protein
MKGISVRLTVLFLATLLAPAAALADTHVFRYDYLDLGHVHGQADGGPSGGGAFADLSASFLDDVQFRARYASLSYPLGVSYKDYAFGFTGESAIDDQVDVYSDVLYVDDRFSRLGHSVSDNGYRLAVGLRGHPHGIQWMEVDGWFAHDWLSADYDPAAGSQQAFLPQSGNEIGLGVLFQPLTWLGLGASFAHDGSHANTTTLRVRLYF